VTALNGDRVTILDVRSAEPSFVGSYENSTFLLGASDIAFDKSKGYVYVTSKIADRVTTIDVRSANKHAACAQSNTPLLAHFMHAPRILIYR
jgi:DNA-binding beta-propeller fold protein YncE